MSTQVQRRKGTTVQHATFTGASAELTVDTTKNTVVVHDGATAGGIPLAKETGSAISATSLTLPNGTANAVAFLNGSKVLTSGTALTFDGSNLGIGTTSPAHKLDVVSAGSITVRAQNTASTADATFSATNSLGSGLFGINATGQYMYGLGSFPLLFYVNGTESMRLTSTGLGIGTSSPGTKLDVQGSAVDFVGISSVNTNSSNAVAASSALRLGVTNTVRVVYSGIKTVEEGTDENKTSLVFSTTNASSVLTDYMRLDSSGNLLVGQTSQTAPGVSNTTTGFAVGGSTGYIAASRASGTVMFLNRNSDGDLLNFNSSGVATYQLGLSSGALTFNNTSERMRLTSVGRLGIGTTAPEATLQVVGTARLGSFDINLSTANSAVWIDGSDFGIGTYFNNSFKFLTANVERARIDTSGNLLVGTTSTTLGSDTANFVVKGFGAGGYAIAASKPANGGVSYILKIVYDNTTSTGQISTTNTTVSYTTSSDYRLKNITGPITTSGAYIDSLKPVEGTWKSSGATFVGLIAHETQEASRTTVATGTKDGDEMQGMDYSSAEIIANLIAELQSLRKRLAAAGI